MTEIDERSVLRLINDQFVARPVWQENNTPENVPGLFLAEAIEFNQAVIQKNEPSDIYSEAGDMVYFAYTQFRLAGEIHPWMAICLIRAEAHVQKISGGRENLLTCVLRKVVRNDMKYPASELQEGDYDVVMSRCRARWDARGGDKWFNGLYDSMFNGNQRLESISPEWTNFSDRPNEDLEEMFTVFRWLVTRDELVA